MTRQRPRAFASLLAVLALAFVALAVVAVARLAAADARRTRDAVADAQCRQLLLAGLDRVAERLADGRPAGDLPAPGGLLLRAEPADGPHAFTLTASTGRRTWIAEAAWEPTGAGGWRLASTTLRPAPAPRDR